MTGVPVVRPSNTPDIMIARRAGTLSGTILNRFYVIPESLLESRSMTLGHTVLLRLNVLKKQIF